VRTIGKRVQHEIGQCQARQMRRQIGARREGEPLRGDAARLRLAAKIRLGAGIFPVQP
jgi:hypothetical protein